MDQEKDERSDEKDGKQRLAELLDIVAGVDSPQPASKRQLAGSRGLTSDSSVQRSLPSGLSMTTAQRNAEALAVCRESAILLRPISDNDQGSPVQAVVPTESDEVQVATVYPIPMRGDAS